MAETDVQAKLLLKPESYRTAFWLSILLRIIPITVYSCADTERADPLNRFLPLPAASDHSTRRKPIQAAGGRPACVSSRELMGGHAEVIIVHDGREYRLRVTQRGKLILTA